jgi:pilus assembly protein Flp/PilA
MARRNLGPPPSRVVINEEESGNWLGRSALIKTFKMFVTNDSGATAIEYALIASLIAVAIIGALTTLGTSLSSEFSEVSGALK